MCGVLLPSFHNHGNIQYCHVMEINCVSKWFKIFQLVRIRFECASRIVDFRHIEIINLINKLIKLRFHYVILINLASIPNNGSGVDIFEYDNTCQYVIPLSFINCTNMN